MERVHDGNPKTLLSMITPAYKVEHFVTESLTSALSQPRANEIELIVIDDGSTDGTLERILKVQRGPYGRDIRVLRRENRGTASSFPSDAYMKTAPRFRLSMHARSRSSVSPAISITIADARAASP
ncbi:glycosyltransferase [Caballeronia catudaia]|uniref:glycosyltransferase n=1 Tax=Caballeronia catudaia TaxID=1777136 RepID=UPI000A932363|nr:glycosyltransferase [Caballeronia catudaia]